MPRSTSLSRTSAPPWAETVASWAGRIVQAVAFWLVLALILLLFAPGFVRTVSDWLAVLNIPTFPSVFSVVLVGVIASGLLRRQRAALWFVVIVWQFPVAVLGLAVGLLWVFDEDKQALRSDGLVLTPLEIASWIVAVAAVILLIAARSAFPARVSKGAWWRAILVLVGGVAVSAFLTLLLLEVFPHTLHGMRNRVNWSLSVALGLKPSDYPLHADGSGPGWLALVAGLISALALVLAIAVFMRSAPHDAKVEAADELAVRKLLLEFPSDDSLEYFATRWDRSAIFSHDQRAAISYRVISGVCLAAGDPIGDKASWPDAIEQWRAHARRFGWVPAVLSTSELGAKAFQAVDLHPIALGDEAIINTRTFTLEGPAMRSVRHAVARPEREGYRVLVRRQAEIPVDELATLVAAADEWRHGEERGFSMSLSRLGDAADPREMIVSAHDADGNPRGLLAFVPWGRRGLSLDVMRRHPEAVSGVTELMVTELVKAGRGAGVDRISMNFAMFRGSFEQGARIGATPIQRFNRRVLLIASRFWQLDSLYKSNEKYLPDWKPRLLCFQNAGQLTQVIFAVGQAEGFLPNTPNLFHRRDRSPDLHRPEVSAAFAEAVRAQETALLTVSAPTRRLTEQQATRHAKLGVLRAAGMEPYPVSVPRTVSIGEAVRQGVSLGPARTTSGHDGAAPAGASASPGDVTTPGDLSVVGRVVRLRDHGGVIFADLREGTDEIQVMFTADRPGPDLALWRRAVDLGDQVSVTGDLTRSRRGELSLHASAWQMASKALTSPPDKHRGLADAEAKVRLKHMELALDTRTAQILRGRSKAVKSLRDSLAARDFIEVETPILQRVHGGANARPFTTHINAYDLDLYLRIAPELFLKRLAIGGVGRVFELGRNFRNEGVDATHNPEFTSLEAYQAYGDYTTMRELTRDLIVEAAIAVHGEPVSRRADGTVVRLDGEWPVRTVHGAVSEAVGQEVTPDTPMATLQAICEDKGVHFTPDMTHGAIVTELYDAFVEGQTVEPTFYTDFPLETSPLTRTHRRDPRLAERWDLVAFGAELGTAYSELIDPVDQRDRLTQQSLLAAAGDPEAMEVDEEFLSALEFAMPPTGGLGIGVDRVYMMLIGASIRETLAFPFVRPSARG
ncbi:bifunctional lysylphosphatidylglycerol synthetase/lysine--tRNA ligase LysX [Oerskovia jenensis]|uniref:Lysine--tRNA ligase n=1 Tax=Oerskovia jenensis TaxID=162169 RepID=A0ABS2LE43_9CELL|nr:bifunctional lysylphosphatidylglycerol synthetase/lysine--tRNA ligase LysX [Oerskovia jenensis]MBM7478681.1 lysyl-tRNA synthetase class 2 [Oerskovia jenensis]